jgi:hypothetical protein
MDNLARCAAARLLAIHATAQPKHPDEPIPREEMEARNKLSTEAGLKEEKFFGGWHINFFCLNVSLPDNKFIAWMDSIKEILSHGTSTAKELKMMIGHLSHLGAIVPFIYHFSKQTQRSPVESNQTTIHCHPTALPGQP